MIVLVLLQGIALGFLFCLLVDIHGRRNFNRIVFSGKPFKPNLWQRFTATAWLCVCRGYGWKESWTRMKYSPNWI